MAGDNSAEERRALAALILAESERDGAGHGRRLPTERQLALDLGVSRSAVRHAMAVLQAEGRVSREVGRGTFLRDPGPEPAAGRGAGPADGAPADGDGPAGGADPASGGLTGSADYAPADVMAVRRLFEPTAMSLVVAWATARDFAEMDRCLRGGERAADHDEFEVWDAALHRSIIAATRSPLLIRLYSEVERARHGRMWGDLKRRSASAARRDEYRRDHEEIVTALRLRDADRATTAMRTHLARVSRHLLGTGLPGQVCAARWTSTPACCTGSTRWTNSPSMSPSRASTSRFSTRPNSSRCCARWPAGSPGPPIRPRPDRRGVAAAGAPSVSLA